MDRTARRFDGETSSRIITTRGRLVDVDRVAFEAFSATLRDELAPKGLLESLYAERAILAAWRLREAIEAERTGVIEGLGADSADLFGGLEYDLRRQSDRAGRGLRKALDALASIRGESWGRAAVLDTTVLAGEGVADDAVVTIEKEVSPAEDVADDLAPIDEPVGDDLPRWQDRLIFDENVSDESPVIRGTWVTVSQVVSLVVDGFTWADILRTHPELTEDDLRVCLAFAHEQESDDGRGVYLP